MNQKRIVIFSLASFFLIVSCYAAYNILVHGLERPTLLDEFSQDDPVLIQYQTYRKHFNYEKEISLIIHKKSQTPFELDELSQLDKVLTTHFQTRTYLADFSRLDKIQLPTYNEQDQTFSTRPLKFAGKIDKEVFAQMKSLSLFKDYPVSSNLNSYLLHLTLKETDRREIFTAMQDIFHFIRSFNKSTSFNMSIVGVEPFRYSIYDEVYRGYFILLPLILFLIILLGLYIFRNFDALFIIFTTLIFSFSTTASIIYLIDGKFSPFSSFSLLFVFVVGTSDIIHLLTDLRQSKSIPASIRSLYYPCFLTSLTTFIGLASLVFSPFQTLFAFGLYGVIGIFVCFVTTFHILPEILKLNIFSSSVNRLILSQQKLKRLNPSPFLRIIKKSKTVLLLSLIFGFLIMIPASRVKFEDDFYKKFTSDHPISQAIEQIQTDFSSLGTIDLFLPKDLLESPQLFHFLEQVESLPEVLEILSSLNVKADLKKLINNTEITARIYGHQALFYSPYGFISQKDPDKQRVIVKLQNFSVETVKEAQAKIQTLLKELGLAKIEVSGFSLLRTHFANMLKKSYLDSLILSFLFIFITFVISFKSFKYATLAMLPNLIPVLTIVAVMGFFQVSADINLPLICSVTLGLCVDDTIHFFSHYQQKLVEGYSVLESITQALVKVGLALVTTSLFLSATLLVFTLGKIQLFSQIGIFLTISSIVALIFDLIVFPTALLVWDKRTANSVQNI